MSEFGVLYSHLAFKIYAFALHIVSLVKNGILENDVSLMIDRLMNKSGFSINGSLYCSDSLSFTDGFR